MRDNNKDDFRPGVGASVGLATVLAEGVKLEANRGLGRAFADNRALLRLDSNLDTALGLVTSERPRSATGGRSIVDRMDFISGNPVNVNLVTVGVDTVLSEVAPGAAACWALVWAAFSLSAKQSSVKLRQILSVLRLSWRSVTMGPPPTLLAALETGPGWPAEPIIEERLSASLAAVSSAV